MTRVELSMRGTALGTSSENPSTYTPSLLHSIVRDETRSALGLVGATPFYGEDVWNCHEFSWLTPNGLPTVACLRIQVPAASGAIVESKSLKLYLNSFALTKFDAMSDVLETLRGDLQIAFRSPVMLDLTTPDHAMLLPPSLPGTSLDDTRVAIDVYSPAPELLGHTSQGSFIKKSWYTQLFRSVCPVTGQPDWATLFVDYAGEEFDPAALLRYLVSYRTHPAFHEATIEAIFMDLLNAYEPKALAIHGRFLRRGGIDINPYRSTVAGAAPELRSPRQ